MTRSAVEKRFAQRVRMAARSPWTIQSIADGFMRL